MSNPTMDKRVCPNCGLPFKRAVGPETTEDVMAMIDNRLHMAGLCEGSLNKAFGAYERMYGHKFGERPPDSASGGSRD